MDNKICIFLGAGFSNECGLPLQGDFLQNMVADRYCLTGSKIDENITNIILFFLHEVFNECLNDPTRKILEKVQGFESLYPQLEDVFTILDLSANSGHYLGNRFSPKLLRSLRRMLIRRVFDVLDSAKPGRENVVGSFLQRLDFSKTSFITTNWDIELEKALRSKVSLKYGSNFIDFDNVSVLPSLAFSANNITYSKLNGSSNWVYCDNCRTIKFSLYQKISLRNNVDLTNEDFEAWKTLMPFLADVDLSGPFIRNQCARCSNILSSHIATFSFKKSYRTSIFGEIWKQAFDQLAEANIWILIGYSLPMADFEILHLMKSAQLAYPDRTSNRKIFSVIKGNPQTKERYQSIFGPKITVIEGGLKNHAKIPINDLN